VVPIRSNHPRFRPWIDGCLWGLSGRPPPRGHPWFTQVRMTLPPCFWLLLSPSCPLRHLSLFYYQVIAQSSVFTCYSCFFLIGFSTLTSSIFSHGSPWFSLGQVRERPIHSLLQPPLLCTVDDFFFSFVCLCEAICFGTMGRHLRMYDIQSGAVKVKTR